MGQSIKGFPSHCHSASEAFWFLRWIRNCPDVRRLIEVKFSEIFWNPLWVAKGDSPVMGLSGSPLSTIKKCGYAPSKSLVTESHSSSLSELSLKGLEHFPPSLKGFFLQWRKRNIHFSCSTPTMESIYGIQPISTSWVYPAGLHQGYRRNIMT